MEERRSPDSGPQPSREERVRALGYDPRHLTPEEQAELLELRVLCPDETLTA